MTSEQRHQTETAASEEVVDQFVAELGRLASRIIRKPPPAPSLWILIEILRVYSRYMDWTHDLAEEEHGSSQPS